jgi:oligopeptide/dipeptide ABC transporter ATP-binding protein
VTFNVYLGRVHAVNDAYLDVAQGEFVGLVGETGCGKSTLGLAVTGLLDRGATTIKGTIFFEGEDLLKKTSEEMREIRRTKMSLIFQDPTASLNPVYTVGDQIVEAITFSRGLSNIEARKEADEMLSLLRIPDSRKVMRQYPHELSGGMRQRVMIAIALSKNPKLVIADEPTSNLDVTIQAQILDLMKDLKEKWNTSMLLITHDMGVVAQTCDKVAVMYAGQVIERGTVFQVFKKALHPYTRGLLKVANLAGEKTRLESIPGTVPDLVDLPRGCLFSPRCPFAQKECYESRPTLIEVEEGHLLACPPFAKLGV